MSETTRVLRYLAGSPRIRALVVREIWRFSGSALVGLTLFLAIRHVRDKPITTGVLFELAVILATGALLLLVAGVRTLRRALREHGYLD
ncbi:MAG: hypothetical protein Q8N18_04075 [Opitutaceae bacterium]|nr:hypothetical protein [Opitutaceae bacterium]